MIDHTPEHKVPLITLSLVLWIWLSGPAGLTAQMNGPRPEFGKEPKTYENGDALPTGAIKRFGSLGSRLEHVPQIAFSPDGNTLANSRFDGKIKLRNVESGKEIATLAKQTKYHITTIAFSPDGFLLASGSNDNTVRIWDLETKKELTRLTGHEEGLSSVAFSPDGALLASGSSDQTVKLWDVNTKKEIATLSGHKRVVRTVDFSPDGALLASGSWDNTIKLWDVENKEEIATLSGHENYVLSVAFSPDGTLLASGSADGTIKLWDVKSKEEIATLSGHSGKKNYVLSVAFSPDGDMLASGSADETIKLWNLNSKKEITTLSGHERWVRSLTFSPDGSTIASGSGGETRPILIWSLDPREWKMTSPIDDPEQASKKQLWNTFSSRQPIAAYQAVFVMAERGETVVPFLRNKINRLLGPSRLSEQEKKRFNKLVNQLGAKRLQKRKQAQNQLVDLLANIPRGYVRPLEERIKQENNPEIKHRLQTVAKRLRNDNPGQLRLLRTIRVLEHIGGKNARTLLQDIAKQKGTSLAGRRASAALKRME